MSLAISRAQYLADIPAALRLADEHGLVEVVDDDGQGMYLTRWTGSRIERDLAHAADELRRQNENLRAVAISAQRKAGEYEAQFAAAVAENLRLMEMVRQLQAEIGRYEETMAKTVELLVGDE